jgi:hypothetical protein
MQTKNNSLFVNLAKMKIASRIFKQNDIIPFDEHQNKLIKIEVSDTTTFFKNRRPYTGVVK